MTNRVYNIIAIVSGTNIAQGLSRSVLSSPTPAADIVSLLLGMLSRHYHIQQRHAQGENVAPLHAPDLVEYRALTHDNSGATTESSWTQHGNLLC